MNTPVQTPPNIAAKLGQLVEIDAMRDALRREIAEEAPPLSVNDAEALINGSDHAFQRDVERWFRNVAEPIDVTLLADADGNHDIDRWHLVGGVPERFEVRSRDTYEVKETDRPADTDAMSYHFAIVDTDGIEHSTYPTQEEADDALADFQETSWYIVDTDCDEEIDTPRHVDESDETEMIDYAEEKNVEAHEEGMMAFPFAWNTGWKISKYDADLFARHGALVYTYDDDLIMGIDGAGYSFYGSHWGPAYLDRAADNNWTVETDQGPRKVVRA